MASILYRVGEGGRFVNMKLLLWLKKEKKKPQYNFVHHKSHMSAFRKEPGPPWCEAGD
jgi:hypothetical protein